jgi:hypothetical protein
MHFNLSSDQNYSIAFVCIKNYLLYPKETVPSSVPIKWWYYLI